MNNRSLKARAACLALVAAPVLALTSCSSGAHLGAAAGKPPAGSSEEFAKLFVGYHADYDAADSPNDLARQSDLVVRGTIVSIDRGRTQVIDASSGMKDTTVVATLKVRKVLRGSLDKDSHRLVYFELPNVGDQNPATYKASLPVGAETVLYGVPSRPGDRTIENPRAGRPNGQPLFTPVNPQGFWLESDDGVIEVLEADSADAPIDETIPPSKEFPESSE